MRTSGGLAAATMVVLAATAMAGCSGAAEQTEEALGVLMPAEGNESPYDPGWTIATRANYVEVRHNRDRPASALETFFEHGLGFDTCGAPGPVW